jgi:gamma-glutamylaminecyclotransferase
LPCTTIPAGFGDGGLPMGVQLIGARGNDSMLLSLAQFYHERTYWPSKRPPPTVVVFVYGTLMTRYGNHSLLKGSQFLGNACTTESYVMSASLVPFVSSPSSCSELEASPIVGEVYRVDKDTLRKLDNLEGHPDWYQRRHVSVTLLTEEEEEGKPTGERTIEAFLYFNDKAPSFYGEDLFHVPTGNFRDAGRYGPDSLRFDV